MKARMFKKAALLLASTPLALGVALAGGATAAAVPVTQTVTVDATFDGPTSPSIDLPVGASVTFTATGTASIDPDPQYERDANGIVVDADCQAGDCPLVGPLGALGIRNGDAPIEFLGTGPTTITVDGPVSFYYNDNYGFYWNNYGEFVVTMSYDDGINPEPEPEPEPGCTGSVCLPTGSFGF